MRIFGFAIPAFLPTKEKRALKSSMLKTGNP
nr:MAG TPA: hypothetical protein [Caudoviricetes sp.]